MARFSGARFDETSVGSSGFPHASGGDLGPARADAAAIASAT
jgi:hypothetical protein